jgi:hypothetical protein
MAMGLGSPLLIFFLFLLSRWAILWGKGSIIHVKDRKQRSQAYAACLRKELIHFQSNSTFVTRTLLEREIAKQEDIDSAYSERISLPSLPLI